MYARSLSGVCLNGPMSPQHVGWGGIRGRRRRQVMRWRWIIHVNMLNGRMEAAGRACLSLTRSDRMCGHYRVMLYNLYSLSPHWERDCIPSMGLVERSLSARRHSLVTNEEGGVMKMLENKIWELIERMTNKTERRSLWRGKKISEWRKIVFPLCRCSSWNRNGTIMEFEGRRMAYKQVEREISLKAPSKVWRYSLYISMRDTDCTKKYISVTRSVKNELDGGRTRRIRAGALING